MATPQPNIVPLIPVGDLLNQAWDMFRKKFLCFLKITLFQSALTTLTVILFLIGYVLFNKFPHEIIYLTAYTLAGLGLIFLIYYFQLRAQISLMYVPASAETKSFSEYFGESKGKIVAFFWLVLLQGLIIFGATLLLIIPGIIIAISLSFAPWVYIMEGKKGMEALQQSRRYSHNRLMPIFGRNLLASIIVGTVVGATKYVTANSFVAYIIVSVIVSFIASGFTICFSYLLYKSASETFAPDYEPRVWQLKAYLGFLVVLIAALFALVIYSILRHSS